MKLIKAIKGPVRCATGGRARALQTSVLIAAVAVAVWVMRDQILAQSVPQPVLKITPTNSSTQILISITNAVASTNYSIYRTPILGDTNFPWTMVIIGSIGQSNFTADVGVDTTGFFRATIGVDVDGDLVPDWMDADSNDPTLGILSITIDSPTNGATLN
jgi:hypothetical protein